MDLQESPAVEAMEPGGDTRLGYRVAAVVLLVAGWGVMVVLNVVLHVAAPPQGLPIGPWVVPHGMGVYAWAVFGFGLVAGVTGVGLWLLSRTSPKGPFVLPGQSFD